MQTSGFPTTWGICSLSFTCTSGIVAKSQATLIVCVFHSVSLHVHFCEKMTLFFIPLTRGIIRYDNVSKIVLLVQDLTA